MPDIVTALRDRREILPCMLLCMLVFTGCTATKSEQQASKDEKLKSALVNMVKKEQQQPPQVVPAPELENVNIYAKALAVKLRRKYNNMPTYAGEVGKVQLVFMGQPQLSLDGKKMRVRWSQVVFDNWGERISELEKEYFEVTFGDGKMLSYRTKPSISVGLANESGYSEFSGVRGRELSRKSIKGNPQMFDRPDSEKNGLLDDNLRSRDSNPLPLGEFDEKGYSSQYTGRSAAKNSVPVVRPAQVHLPAIRADL